MSSEFASRLIGMVVFALLGARLGVEATPTLEIPQDAAAFILALVGILIGLILTPWITVRPIRVFRRTVNEMPIEVMFIAFLGLVFGLAVGLLLAYPLSLLTAPFGDWAPPAVSIASGYLGLSIFTVRSHEILTVLGERLGSKRHNRLFGSGTARQLLLDTSVLIDGRIVDIAETGFLGGTLIVPRFVLSELQRVADSSDPLRRNRGRRGLSKVNQLKDDAFMPFKIVDDDFDDISSVDDKLIMLSLQLEAPVITNDFNLNKVAEAQGISVLNVNKLANAVRSVYIPGESFHIHVIQEGTEAGQGVGYLEDGTMVVIENGRRYMDRTIGVTVTRLINREAGRMLFATPAQE